MACSWSTENAANAYLRAMRMATKQDESLQGKEPNGSEFISAMAAGNNAQFMVVACGGSADSTTLALLVAAQQTGGRVICIVRGQEELHASKATLGINASSSNIEFVVGDVTKIIFSYEESDFIAIDCNLENHEEIISSLQEKVRHTCIVLGYNAFCKVSWRNSPLRTQLLPIGEGLLLTRATATAATRAATKKSKSSNWIVTVDKCTGEEHVFRVRSSVGRIIRA